MKLWIGAEYSGDIGDVLRLTRNHVEDTLLEYLKDKEYEIKLDSWDVIIVLMEDDSYSERTIYWPGRNDMDFRLKIDYEAFKNGDMLTRLQLIFDMLLRSLDILKDKMKKKKIPVEGLVSAVG